MPSSPNFCNTFIKAWDENIGEFIKKYGANGVENNNILIINNNETVKTDYLPPTPLRCFYNIFNGSVCDEDHWNFYNECLNYTRIKNNFTPDDIKFLNTFREYWNENINESMKHAPDNYNENKMIIVVAPNELRWFELTPAALQCFYLAFNGSVCDLDHWQYFTDCLEIARKTSGVYTETYNIRRRRNYYV